MSAFTRVFDALWAPNPESITTAAEYGFWVRSLRERPGMTGGWSYNRYCPGVNSTRSWIRFQRAVCGGVMPHWSSRPGGHFQYSGP